MDRRNAILIMLYTFFVISIFVFIPGDAMARAGGGGGKGGGILALIFWPFFVIYSAILGYFVVKKNKESRALLEKIRQFDNSWGIDHIKSRIELVYFKVQEAWMERNQDLAKEYMSERLFFKHKTQTDQMIQQGRKNILERINLMEAKIVEVADYNDDSKDQFWVFIKGSMIDYLIHEESGTVIQGDREKPEHFTELWKFVRGPDDWVLDEIDQDAEILEVKNFKSFSESVQE
jgi:predicted lipid-binding transport protein (Tim44 family)